MGRSGKEWEGVGILSFLFIGTFSSRERVLVREEKLEIYKRGGEFFVCLFLMHFFKIFRIFFNYGEIVETLLFFIFINCFPNFLIS